MDKIKELFGKIKENKRNAKIYIIIIIIFFLIWSVLYIAYNVVVFYLLIILYVLFLILIFNIYWEELVKNKLRELQDIKKCNFLIVKKNDTSTKKNKKYINNDFSFLCIFLLILSLLVVLWILTGENRVLNILRVTFVFSSFIIILHNVYVTFYIFPMVIFSLVVKVFDYSFYHILGYLFIVLILFFIISLVYPVPILRKLDKFHFLWMPILGIVFVLSIQGSIDNYNVNNFNNMSILKELLNKFNLVLIQALSLQIFIVKSILHYYDKQAKKKYNELLNNENNKNNKKIYKICKECIYFGGESYRNRILDNQIIRKVIMNQEMVNKL